MSTASRDAILERLQVRTRGATAYVPSECLVYLLREARRGNNTAWFNRLYSVLDLRVRNSLSHTVRAGSVSDVEGVREEVRSRFNRTLALGLGPEPERLDPFESMFDGALAALRMDMYGAQRRRDNKKADLTVRAMGSDDDGDGDERELAQPEPELRFGMTETEFEPYRLKALASIDSLPDDLRLPMKFFLEGMKIESTDPGEMTIAKKCGVVEKTVRNRIARGTKLIREMLERKAS
ncbi:hypothetical protein ASF25_17575 [Methylobacterium sp. Leaf100]|nr:hypothetical protein ASF25_17575 [Methylobacterium sp. Leaf100]